MARVLPYTYRDTLDYDEHYELHGDSCLFTVYAHNDKDAIDFCRKQDLITKGSIKLIKA